MPAKGSNAVCTRCPDCSASHAIASQQSKSMHLKRNSCFKVVFAWAMSQAPGLSEQQALHAVTLLLCKSDGLSVALAASRPGLHCCCEPPDPAKHMKDSHQAPCQLAQAAL